MVWWLAVGAVASQWDGQSADVVASAVVPLPRAAIEATLSDWKGWQAVVPCAEVWQIGDPSAGVGAEATAVWTLGPLRRHKVSRIVKIEPGLVLETEAAGSNGWFTQVTYADSPSGGTLVTLTTPLGTPKWPVAKLFFTKVKPAWEACYRDTLTRLAMAPPAP
ncbi:MAG: SRPBCC family protein [Myxococcota bacterium]